MICSFLIILIFSFDRISKIKVIDNQLNNEVVYINDFINFDLVWNTGIGFGFFSSHSSLTYNLITALIGIVIIFGKTIYGKQFIHNKSCLGLRQKDALGSDKKSCVGFRKKKKVQHRVLL